MSNISDIGGAYHWSISKFSEVFGIDRRTVKSRLMDAQISAVGEVRGSPVYDLRYVAPALFGSPSSQDPDARHDPSQMPPKERKDWYDSEKGRLWLEKEQRQLIPASEVVTVYSALAKSAAQVLNTLPDILERDLAMPPAAVSRVQAIIDSLRDTLADQMYETSAVALNLTEEDGSNDR